MFMVECSHGKKNNKQSSVFTKPAGQPGPVVTYSYSQFLTDYLFKINKDL